MPPRAPRRGACGSHGTGVSSMVLHGTRAPSNGPGPKLPLRAIQMPGRASRSPPSHERDARGTNVDREVSCGAMPVTNDSARLTASGRCSSPHTSQNSTKRRSQSEKTKCPLLPSKVGTMPMRKLTAVVVDDEPLARERLMGLLASESDVEVLAECRDGEEAVSAIHERHPDLVLLDVEMPRMDGFEVIDTIGPERMPMVIFVTAYDQHAIKAFQVRALDYLLKPFDRDRFSDALQRARTQIESQTNGDLGKRLLALMKDMKRDTPKTDRLVVKSGGRLFFLRADEIDWIEAAGNYVRLHV